MWYVRMCDIDMKSERVSVDGEKSKNGNDGVIRLGSDVMKVMMEVNML